ncbi:hypothetical protein ACJIZ3_009959 [Penstemon smallii]|uniref:Kinetochore protein SPC25 n=1 Tax=Penstemon smallii TaxID=265156 RepID=A0ABD3TFA6_9LAMI
MQGDMESSMRTRMAELRLACDREIPTQQQKIDSSVTVYRNLLDSSKSKAQETIQLQGDLGKLKLELREAENALVKSLAVKTRKEANHMTMMESLSATKARVQELKRIVEDQRARKDEYASIISHQSEALTACRNNEHREQIEEAFSWYNSVLGFRIECGHGVKFVFTNISSENPNKEYYFIIRHENEIYTLLDCDPHQSDTKELVSELNKSNGLFKFVRTMRKRFLEAATCGKSLDYLSFDQDSSIISISAPVASDSTDVPSSASGTYSRKVGKGHLVHSPGGSASCRRSPRLKAKK